MTTVLTGNQPRLYETFGLAWRAPRSWVIRGNKPL
jgi:hypothetical protein